MDQFTLRMTIPELSSDAASGELEVLQRELKRDSDLRGELDTIELERTNKDTSDFGATLVAVLSTSAVTYLCRAVYRWAERTGTSVVIDGIEIKNVRSEDIPKIAKALTDREPKPGNKGGGFKRS